MKKITKATLIKLLIVKVANNASYFESNCFEDMQHCTCYYILKCLFVACHMGMYSQYRFDLNFCNESTPISSEFL